MENLLSNNQSLYMGVSWKHQHNIRTITIIKWGFSSSLGLLNASGFSRKNCRDKLLFLTSPHLVHHFECTIVRFNTFESGNYSWLSFLVLYLMKRSCIMHIVWEVDISFSMVFLFRDFGKESPLCWRFVRLSDSPHTYLSSEET